MKTIMLGIGEYAVSNIPGHIIKTMSLGSCVALTVYHPVSKSVGMVHIALPESNINVEGGNQLPGRFADTGVKVLLEELIRLTSLKRKRDWVVKIVGGANVVAASDFFKIGERNVTAIKRHLHQRRLYPVAEDIYGTFSRTVSIEVNTGKVRISSPGRGSWEI